MSKIGNKEVRNLVKKIKKLAIDDSFSITQRNKLTVKWSMKNKQGEVKSLAIHMPKTPSDYRSMKNAVCFINRTFRHNQINAMV